MKKRIFSIMLTLCMVLSFLPTKVFAATPYNYFNFTISGNKVTIDKYIGSDTVVEIPSKLSGFPVTSIGNGAFRGCSGLTSVMIPNSVTLIGYRAFFGCIDLTSITIPNSVISIGDYAFEECSKLANIEIPNSVTSIGYYAFDRYHLNNIFLPKDLDVTNVNIPGQATKVRYSLENGMVTITGIALGTGKTSVDIPATICGYSVVEVADGLLDEISSHTCIGGTASCTSKASCSLCGKEYGELLAHDIENIPAKDATVAETGNKEYWHCKDCGKYFSDKDGKSEIIDLAAWKTGEGIISKLSPEIIEGKGQSITAGEKKDLIFRSNAAFRDFIRVELDGKNHDEKNYTVKEGSTIVILKADYVGTLSAGEHTIGIVSTSGTATTAFTVNAKAAVDNDTKSLQTNDNSQTALWITLLFFSGCLLIVTGVNSKKKKFN